MALPAKSTRYPVPLSLGVGGGAGAVIPPEVVYAKLPAHAIYYNPSSAVWSDAKKNALSKYSSISFNGAQWLADPSAQAAGMAAIRLLNPSIKLYGYMMQCQILFPEYDYGGAYPCTSKKLAAADWVLRNADNSFPITYGAGAGTSLPDRGAWTSSTSYAVNDVVLHSGEYKKCTVANSDVSFTAGKWTTSIGYMNANYMPGVLPDHGGLNWIRWFARHGHQIHTRNGMTWDGMYLDSGFGVDNEYTSHDWLNDGVNRNSATTTAIKDKAAENAGLYEAELKLLFGSNFKLIPNGHWNADANNMATEMIVNRNLGTLYADGWLHESTVAPSVSWSAVTWNGFEGTYGPFSGGWNIKTEYVKNPSAHLSILGVGVTSATQYATARLGIAAAAMRDGRASVTDVTVGYAAALPLWFDEWDQPLGIAIDARLSAASHGQIWKRRFQNGVILMNQTRLAVGTNRGAWADGVAYSQGQYVTQGGKVRVCRYGQGHTSSASFAADDAAGLWHSMTSTAAPVYIAGAPVTIDSSIIPYGIYKRFSGTQDPVHNSGATVSGSFTLNGWDGIILLCVTPGVHS